MFLNIIERITLDERRYLEALRKVDGEVDKSARKHKKAFGENDKNVDRSEKKLTRFQSVVQKVGMAIKVAIGTVAVGAVMALRSGVRMLRSEWLDFDSQMTKSLAIMGDVSEEQQKRMRDTARATAREFNFTAGQMAEAYFFLASAGMDVEQQIESIGAVAQFAKAGMFDLATATDLATDAQSALGLKSENAMENLRGLTRVTDVLVKANTLANATVEQFATSLTNRAAAALRTVNKDIEEGVAVLSAWADQGIKGQRAGQALNILLRDLQRGAQENAEEWSQLGITVFDTEGRMRNMADIIEDVENAMEGATDQQVRQRLSLLGLREESLIYIQTLLGMSGNIRDYEAQLREAGGATEEVANNQLVSLNERLEQSKRRFSEAFGDATLGMLEKSATALERMSDALEGFNMQVDRARRIEELLPAQQRGQWSWFGGLIGGGADRMRRAIGEDMDAQAETTSKLNARIQYLSQSVIELHKNLEELEMPIEDQEAHTEAIDRNIEQLQRLQTAWKVHLESLRDQLENRQMSPLERARVIVNIEELEKRLNLVGRALEEVGSITRKTNTEAVQHEEVVERMSIAYRKLEDSVERLGDTSLKSMESLIRATGDYETRMAKLHNLRTQGLISEEQFAYRSRKATEEYMNQLTQLYQRLSALGLITPELEREFQRAFDQGKRGAKEMEGSAEDLHQTLRSLADALDAIVNMADTFGDMSDGMRKASRGAVSLLRNLSRISELRKMHGGIGNIPGLDLVVPGLGVAAGVASIIGGMMSGRDDSYIREQMQRMNELTLSLESLQRAVERNTEAFFRQSVVGADVRERDIDRAKELLESIMGRGAIETIGRGMVPDSERNRIRSVLTELGELFPELFGNALRIFEERLEKGESVMSILQNLGLPRTVSELESLLGSFGKSLEGAIAEFNAVIRFGGAETGTALRQFIDNLKELDIPQGIIDKLEQVALLDLTSEEGQEALREIIQSLFERGVQGSNLTPREFDRLLEFLEGMGSGVTVSDADEFARSTQIARTITDIQANEVIALLEAIEYWNRQMAGAMGSETAMSLSRIPATLSSPVPVRVVNWEDLGASKGSEQTFNVEMINHFDGFKGHSTDVDEISRRLVKKFERELFSKKF